MTPLRQKMIDLMAVKNFAPSTQASYLYSVCSLVKYYHLSPDQLTQDDIQRYLIYLMKERHLAPSSCRLQLNGIRFFYRQVLKWPDCKWTVLYPRRPQKIPELLTRQEARRIISTPSNLKHQTLLQVCYGAGLRVSEVVRLRIRHIDGERHLLRVEQGKGAKDRLIPLSTTLLSILKKYWYYERPYDYLFFNRERQRPLTVRTAQRIYRQAKALAGVDKQGGIHSLRHAFATHQLESGLPIHLLQCWLGHANIKTTLRYIHWVPTCRPVQGHLVDLLETEGGAS